MTRDEYVKLLEEQIEALKKEQASCPGKTIEFSKIIFELAKELFLES